MSDVRKRALEALHPEHALTLGCAHRMIDALKAAGLRIVDAAEHDRDQRLLRESIDALAAGPKVVALDGSWEG